MQILAHSGAAGKRVRIPGNGFKTGGPQSPQHWTARPKLARGLAKFQQASLKTQERDLGSPNSVKSDIRAPANRHGDLKLRILQKPFFFSIKNVDFGTIRPSWR